MDLSTVIFLCVVIVGIAFGVAWYATRMRRGPLKVDIGGQTPRAQGGEDASRETGFKNRLMGLSVFSGTILGVLLARLWSMQLVSTDEYSEQAELNRTRTVTSQAPRGRILDRNGEELVTNRASLTVVATAEVADDEREVRLLANLLGMPEVAVRRNIQDATEGPQSPRTVAVDVSRTAVAYLKEHPDLFPNITVEERSQRSYPKGSLAAHVLGYTGPVTAEQLEAQADSDETKIAYESGDVVGQAGVELQYEEILQGIHGERNVYVDADGNLTGLAGEVPPSAGSDIVLTIDAKIQKAAEEGLRNAIDHGIGQGATVERGCLLVMDPRNGELLALASYPTYEPSLFVGGIGMADWEALNDEKSGYPLLDRCVSGTYPSASTIKPLSTYAALDNGIASPDSWFYCPGFWTGFGEGSGQYCWDHAGHGSIDLRGGIVYSCDSVFYEIGKAIFLSDNKEALQQKYRQWGLGSKTGVDLPSEEAGRVPDAEWKWNYFSNLTDDERVWYGGDNTNLVIGQGDLLVTPIQMARVYGGIANGGTLWRPHVLKEVLGADGEGSVFAYEPVSEEAGESKESIDFTRDALKGVIYEEDASMAAHFTNLPVQVAGKTGTAERQGAANPTGWFVAYAPVDDPQYVVLCLVEEGGFGSQCALYGVRDVLGAIYDSPDDTSAAVTSGIR